MAVSIAELLRRWRSVDVMEETKDIIGETSDDIIHLNQEQLLNGEGSDGADLPYYKRYKIEGREYGDIKQSMNPNNGGRYDMRYTGESFSSMSVKLEGEKMTIMSRGEAQAYENGEHDSANKISVKGRIFGLNTDNKEQYRNNVLTPLLVRRIAEITGAKTNMQ